MYCMRLCQGQTYSNTMVPAVWQWLAVGAHLPGEAECHLASAPAQRVCRVVILHIQFHPSSPSPSTPSLLSPHSLLPFPSFPPSFPLIPSFLSPRPLSLPPSPPPPSLLSRLNGIVYNGRIHILWELK